MALDFRNYLCCSYCAFSKTQEKDRKDCTLLELLLTTPLRKYITTLGEGAKGTVPLKHCG